LSSLRRYFPLFTLVIAITSFYLYNLSAVGLLGPDEPRYAAIGRTMAQSGDWITPTLWGAHWFEKPPLLYWLTAVATSLGAPAEISARLPVALLSLAFLAVFCWLLSKEFGSIPAIIGTATLATSAGWIAYSNLCLTDLPLACFFSLSLILLLPRLRPDPVDSQTRLILSGVCFGLAILAKGLVPIVLFLPALWFFRRQWRQWPLFLAVSLIVALPWYLLVYQRNGYPFIEDFILKQHFQRFYSPALEHVHPWYYYFPVLLGILFPWTPLFVRLFLKPVFDARHQFLLTICAFGFVFFSASLNKLNGYLLPLVPLLFTVLGSAFHGPSPFTIRKRWLVPCALLVAFIPFIALAIPPILSAGRITGIPLHHLTPTNLFYIAAPLAAVFLARRSWAPTLLVLCVIGGGFFIKIVAFPLLDQQVSARTFWNRQIQPIADKVCEEWIRRDWVYGLSFYRGQLIPPCYLHPTEWHLKPRPRTTPGLVDTLIPFRKSAALRDPTEPRP
jgi:4-amino-4-deoxy-L-arabinose transferase-like glycosyltransferase